jgi:hypothetical protein
MSEPAGVERSGLLTRSQDAYTKQVISGGFEAISQTMSSVVERTAVHPLLQDPDDYSTRVCQCAVKHRSSWWVVRHPARPHRNHGDFVLRPRRGQASGAPWADDIGRVMPLSLSYDHRVIDGAIGRSFLAEVTRHIEEPSLLAVPSVEGSSG